MSYPFTRSPGQHSQSEGCGTPRPQRSEQTSISRPAQIPKPTRPLAAIIKSIWARSYQAALHAPDDAKVQDLAADAFYRWRGPLSTEDRGYVGEVWDWARHQAAEYAADESIAEIREAIHRAHPAGLTPGSSDLAIRETAEELASDFRASTRAVLSIINSTEIESAIDHDALMAPSWRLFLESHQIDIDMEYPGVGRATDPLWWRRVLRSIVRKGRGIIDHLIAHETGERDWIYVSDRALCERREQRARNEEIIDTLELVAPDGDILPMRHVVESAKRRRDAELSCRVYGLSQLAASQGMQAFFVTITLSSRMHLSSSSSTAVTPDKAYQFLRCQWSKWRAMAHRKTTTRDSLRSFGQRIIEPHEDGTPHMHLIIWTDDEARLRRSLAKYFLGADAVDEPGAYEYRLTIEPFRAGIAGVLSYILKYLKCNSARSVDAENFDKVDAWKGAWGIRSFSFFSTHTRLPSITPWRELRKVPELPIGSPFGRLHIAARSSQYDNYCRAWWEIGGVRVVRKDRANKYGEIGPGRVTGIVSSRDPSLCLELSNKYWVIQQKAARHEVTLIDREPSKEYRDPPVSQSSVLLPRLLSSRDDDPDASDRSAELT